MITVTAFNPQGQEIVVEFNGDKTTITTRGFSGSACTDATRPLEHALGVVVSDTPTDEAYRAAGAQAIRQ